MKVKKKPSQRVIAALLALFILLTMGQSGLIGVFAAETDFAVTVLDENSEKVKGATVTVISAVDSDSKTVIDENTLFSDENNDGVIELTDIAKYLETNDTTISLNYYVSAENYQNSQTSYINIDKENVQEGTTVSLEHNPTVSLSVTGYENAPIKAFLLADKDDTVGMEINLTDDKTDYVPVGSYVKFEIPALDYYTSNISAKSGEDDATAFSITGSTYIYEITDDFVLNVTYSPVMVNVEVEYDSEKGIVKYNGSDAESGEVVSVNKNDIQTVFTITPKEHYVLSNVKLNDIDQTLPPKEDDGTYICIILNEDLDSSTTYKLNFAFELDQYVVNYRVSGDSENVVTATYKENQFNSGNLVTATNSVSFAVKPSEGKFISNVSVNGNDVPVNYVDDSYTFTIQAESNPTNVDIILNDIDTTTLENYTVDDFINVENAVKVGDTYYVKKGNFASLAVKENDYSIDSITAKIDGKNVVKAENITIADNAVINSVRLVDYLGASKFIVQNTYFVSGSINIVFDEEAPIISDIKNKEFTNVSENIPFNVSDDLSGVAYVIVSNDYDGTQVTLKPNDKGDCVFTAPVRNDYTGTVTYTVTATDNVGNVSTKNFTVNNDTQAPVLDDSNEEQKPINFKNNNDSIFHRILNAIGFGKWLDDKITVDFSVTDSGVGFGEKSYVTVLFVPENSLPKDGDVSEDMGKSYSSKAGDDFVTVEDDFGGVFKGNVYYKLTDDLGNPTKEWTMITSSNSNIDSPDLSSDDNEINIIMIESNKPTIEINPTSISGKQFTTENDPSELIYNGDAKFDITVKDDDSGIFSYDVTINGKSSNDDGTQVYPIEEKIQDSGTPVYSKNLSVTTEGLTADENGKYVVKVAVIDNSGNYNEETFTVYKDTTIPVIKGFEFDPVDGSGYEEGSKSAVETTNYGFYFKQDVEVTITAEDPQVNNEINSGVKSISYMLIDENGEKYLEGESTTLADGSSTSFSIEVEKGFKGQIYAKATDNVDNVSDFVHPDGTVVESIDKHSETSSISIVAPQAVGTQNTAYSYSYNLNNDAVADNELSYPDSTVKVPLYNSNPTFNVTVSDSYSGIRNVKWTIIEGSVSRSDYFDVPNVIDANTTQIKGWNITENDENLVTQMTGSITVDGNHNDMVVVVELTDRAGNISYDYYVFGIDKTAPSIAVSYNNNNADTASGNGIAYFDANRTATIVVSERNFNSENVVVNVTKDGKTYPVALSWRDEAGTSSNGDDTRHITSITYDSDGDYTFSVSYTDRAQNKNNGVNYGNSVAPTSFTVDKTAPVISVSYNNNNAQNGKYFKTSRTATIVITEHNFDVNRVVFTRAASLSGSNITLPSVSWSNNGDVHTATINYNADGDYKFDIAMDDMAGNVNNGVDYGSSVAANDFTVDQRIDNVGISFSNNENGDVTDLKSFNDIVRPIINVNDVNYSNVNVILTRKTRNSTDEGIENLLSIPNGNGTFTSDNFPDEITNDGIYHLTVVLTDKAGNSNTAEETFTVNRYGSVYVFNDVLNNAISNTYNQSLSGNVVITEYNASPISDEIIQVTRDSAPVSLDANVNSNTGDSIGESGWYENVYTIPQSVFAADGIYNIYVSSEDGSQNTPEMTKENIYNSQNELAGKDASFIIDATKPQIVNVYSDDVELSGDQVIANAESLTINYEISDNIAIDTITIYKGAKDTNPEIIKMDEVISGKSENGKSDNYSSFSGSITVENGFNEDEIIFKIVDKAGNVINTSPDAPDKEKYDLGEFTFLNNVTVDTNPFVLWYANKPLFWGSIGALVAIIIGVFLVVFLKKRKNNNDEEKA